jgi:hypothetical protein
MSVFTRRLIVITSRDKVVFKFFIAFSNLEHNVHQDKKTANILERFLPNTLSQTNFYFSFNILFNACS